MVARGLSRWEMLLCAMILLFSELTTYMYIYLHMYVHIHHIHVYNIYIIVVDLNPTKAVILH